MNTSQYENAAFNSFSTNIEKPFVFNEADNKDFKILIDEFNIKKMLNQWVFYRDRMDMIPFKKLWSKDGSMHVGFFEGTKDAFIKTVVEKKLDSRHFLSEPYIKISDDRAIAKTYCLLLVRSEKPLVLDITAHIQFYDMLIKESKQWKLFKRYVTFDKDRLDFLSPSPLKTIIYNFLDVFFLRKYPKNTRHLYFAWKLVLKLEIPKYHPIIYKSKEENAVIDELNSWIQHKEPRSQYADRTLADLMDSPYFC